MYLEPRTDVPAEQDWSTALTLAETRSAGRIASGLVVLLPIAVCAVVFLPATAGNISAVVVLVLLGLFGSIGLLMLLSWRRPHRGRLLGEPWRRCRASVAEADTPMVLERVLVFEEGRTLVLRGALHDLVELLLHRRELFVVGPDADGRALVRVAGLCRLFPTKVDTTAVRALERDGPGEEVVPLRSLRHGALCWLYPAVIGAVGAVVLTLGLLPVAPLPLVVGGVLLIVAAVAMPIAVVLARYYSKALTAAEPATDWTPLAVTLFPWEPTDVVAGLVQLSGRTSLIQFPLPNLEVIANIADTGTLWIRGAPSDVVAVGAPQLPVMTFGLLQSDRDKPPDEPQPWLLRARDPGLREIPALRG